jgi:hypothetical protein
MAPASVSPPPGERSAGERSEAGGRRPGERTAREERETCGPLDIERHVKDDGRALILYTRREREDG